MNQSLKNALPVALSITGSIGVVATAYLVARETPKFNEELSKLDKPTFGQKTKLCLKHYAPAIGVGTATIASITASTVISRKAQASLAASLMLAKQGYTKYGDQVKKLIGLEKNGIAVANMSEEETIEDKMINEAEKSGKRVFYNKYIGFFIARKDDVLEAILGMNRHLCAEDTGLNYCTLEQFINDSNSKVCNSKQFDLYKDCGWDTEYLCLKNDSPWIDYRFINRTNSDGVEYTVLEFDGPEPFESPESGYEVPRPYTTR